MKNVINIDKVEVDKFIVEKPKKDWYKIKLEKSYLNVVIQKVDGDVEICYISSHYEMDCDKRKLIDYATNVIALKLNKGKPFGQVEFEQA